ncbi:Hypothetical protein (plasmid) [Pseudomonas putida]|nr:Hypothetical protein [Pseudomonas putida]
MPISTAGGMRSVMDGQSWPVSKKTTVFFTLSAPPQNLSFSEDDCTS